MCIRDRSMQRALIFPARGSIAVSRVPGGWHIGSLNVSGSVLALFPGSGGTLSVNDSAYRGSLRFVPLDDGGFDVVNDVEIDDYLKGVLAVELYRDWQLEAYKAQAVVARTYALYHSHTEGLGRYWDCLLYTSSTARNFSPSAPKPSRPRDPRRSCRRCAIICRSIPTHR